MACCQPLHIANSYYNPRQPHSWHSINPYWCVPCGYCLNCRVDRRNWLEDACNYEHSVYGCGAFVTLTYDDPHIKPLLRYDNSGKLVATLSPDDIHRFIDRLRHKIKYDRENSQYRDFLSFERSKFRQKHCRFTNKVFKADLVPSLSDRLSVVDDVTSLNKYINPDFKVLYVGEYGGRGTQFDRPHFHCLFFGLSWKYCRYYFDTCWKNGIVDVGFIGSGAIRYVLKYLDKQIKGKEAESLYDDNNLSRPFCCHSVNFGTGLILNQLEAIRDHNYQYRNFKNQLRPVPVYYKNKLLVHSIPDYSSTVRQMLDRGIKPDMNRLHSITQSFYSLNELNAFRHRMACTRNESLRQLALRDGNPMPIYDYISTSPPAVDFNHMTEIALYGDIVPF